MKRTVLINLVVALAVLAAAPPDARAQCSSDFSTTLVTYYESEYQLPPASQRDETAESICSISTRGNRRICTVRLWGALHRPFPYAGAPSEKLPTLIFNHGSEETFAAEQKYCEVAKYFVPKGYAVFTPFRRGQGDPNNAAGNRRSSGRYIEDLLDDFDNDASHHNTTCTSRPCYKAQMLKLEADEEVAFAMHYLTVTKDMVTRQSGAGGLYRLAVGGSSYGGAVTVYFNRIEHGHEVVMPFAPAAQNWGDVNFLYAAQGWDLSLDRATLLGELLFAAHHAQRPAFYLQAKWDYDTRATVDLAYAHAYGSLDPTHGNRFMASIFPYKRFLFADGTPDYQSAHAGFASDTDVWGASVLAFLKLYGVE